jgi:hypothetical protein
MMAYLGKRSAIRLWHRSPQQFTTTTSIEASFLSAAIDSSARSTGKLCVRANTTTEIFRILALR